MKQYTPAEIKEFLLALDRNLTVKAELVIIGGTAAALGYRFTNATQDIDTTHSVSGIESAIQKAKAETGYDIPIGPAGIYDPPYSYQDRLIEYAEADFGHLTVLLPEAIDLILMKAMRAEAHDLQAIEQIVKDQRVTVDQILSRYLTDMNSAIKKESDRDFNVASVIAHCFGDEVGSSARDRIRSFRKSQR